MLLKFFNILLLLQVIFGCARNETYNVNYREEMRKFVKGISSYAKSFNPNFIVIPQNGQELLTENGEPEGKVVWDYFNSIDGIGREELFYGYEGDDIPTPDSIKNYLIPFLDIVKNNGKKVLVTDYCKTPSFIDDSYNQNAARGYISFAATHRELDNIPSYPPLPYNVNQNDIISLQEAKNFLYLINPSSFPTREDFLNAIRNTDYDLLIIDLFYKGVQLTKQEVNSLKIKKNGGKRLVIAYMSIGEAEDYRYYWKEEWRKNPPEWLGKKKS